MDIKNKHQSFGVLLSLFCLVASCNKAAQNNHFYANYKIEFEEYTDTTLYSNHDKNHFIILKDLDDKIVAKVKQYHIFRETEGALQKKWYSLPRFNGTIFQHFRHIDSSIVLEQQKENLAYNALLPLNIMLKREGVKDFIPTNSPEYKAIDSLTGLFTGVSFVLGGNYITKADSTKWSRLNQKYNTPKYDSIINGFSKKSIDFLKKNNTKEGYKQVMERYERTHFVFKKNYTILQKIKNDTSKTRIYYANYNEMNYIRCNDSSPKYYEFFVCVEQKKDAQGFVQIYVTLLNPSIIYVPSNYFNSRTE